MTSCHIHWLLVLKNSGGRELQREESKLGEYYFLAT
jgi:hypothetical protein